MVESMDVDLWGPCERNGRCSYARQTLAKYFQWKHGFYLQFSCMLGFCVVPLPSDAKEI